MSVLRALDTSAWARSRLDRFAQTASPRTPNTSGTLEHSRRTDRAIVGADGKSVRLYVSKLQEGNIHDLTAAGVLSAEGLSLLHKEAYYTLNYVPAK